MKVRLNWVLGDLGFVSGSATACQVDFFEPYLVYQVTLYFLP